MKKFLILFVLLFFACPVFAFGEQININTATLSQLDELTGIGQTYAQRIIDNRPYSTVDDLSRVKGIGSATLQKIKAQGFACVNCSTTVENSAVVNNTAPEQTLALEPNSVQNEPKTAISYPNGVFFNEILPDPAGPDETDEWIELANQNNFDVDLSGWKIQDSQGTSTTFTIPQNTKILANSFWVLKRPETKIMLNNNGDGLNLLTPDGKIIDSVNYTKALLGQSYNKTKSGWSWSTTLTPNSANIVTALTTKTKKSLTSSASGDLPKSQKTANNNIVGAELADLSQNSEPESNPWFLFWTVLATAVLLASVILFIKLKLQKNVRT